MNVLWEAMVAEMRAVRAELDHRRHFTEDKQPIELTRDLLVEWTGGTTVDVQLTATRTATSLSLASDLIEVG